MEPTTDAAVSPDPGLQLSPPQRDPTRGAILLLMLALVPALSAGVCTLGVSRVSDSEWLEIIPAVCIIFPTLVNIGFALAIPLLWFPQVAQRLVLAVFIPLLLWSCLMIGFDLPPDMAMDKELFLEATSVMLVSVVGASIPVFLVMWAFKWRIQTPKHVHSPRAIGIVDLLALTALGAGIFAYERQWGIFIDQDVDLRTTLLGISFYGLLGILVALAALLSMRIALAADRRPFRLANLIGITMSFALVGAGWAMLTISSDGIIPQNMNLWLVWFLFSALTWISAAITSCFVCWWLRRYQFVLTSAAMEKSLRRL